MNLLENPTLKAFYNEHIAAGFYKAWSWLIGLAAIVIGLLPDLINLVITNWSMVDGLPTLSPEHKLYLFATVTVINQFVKAWQQKNTREATLKQAAEQGQITSEPNSEALTIQVADKAPVVIVPPVPPASPS